MRKDPIDWFKIMRDVRQPGMGAARAKHATNYTTQNRQHLRDVIPLLTKSIKLPFAKNIYCII
jgi:hypothetical protein